MKRLHRGGASALARRTSLALPVLLIGISLAACAAGDSDPRTGAREIEAGGRSRSYLVHWPEDWRREDKTPLLLVFHGGFGTGRSIRRQTQLDQVADRHGFIAVYPDGLWRTWNAGGCCERSMREKIDDVAFVSLLIDELDREFGIDRSRVFATGFSNGAMLAHRLACELSDRIAAIAPVSGVIMVPPCQPPHPVSVLVVHGTKDPRSLWEGGLGDKNPNKGTRESIPRTMERLNARYACQGEERVWLEQGAVRCVSRSACDGGSEVALCRVDGGGHQWPGSEAIWEGKLGPANQDVSASELMWEFFKKHPRPGSRTEVSTLD